MNFISKISPEWSLRVGIGIMYLHSGFDILFHPTAWHWALPYWLQQMIGAVMPIDTYLRVQGAIELAMAFFLLAWFLKKDTLVQYIALLSTLEMAAILFLAFVPWNEANFSITFRDIGLLGGSLALASILFQKERPLLSTSQ